MFNQLNNISNVNYQTHFIQQKHKKSLHFIGRYKISNENSKQEYLDDRDDGVIEND